MRPGMTVDEYLAASGYDVEAAKASSLPLLDWLPPITELTPQWIFFNFLLPALALFLVNLASTPLQDKLLFGKEYEIDWSGRSGRLFQLLFGGDPLAVPDAPTDMKVGGDLEELRQRRAQEEISVLGQNLIPKKVVSDDNVAPEAEAAEAAVAAGEEEAANAPPKPRKASEPSKTALL